MRRFAGALWLFAPGVPAALAFVLSSCLFLSQATFTAAAQSNPTDPASAQAPSLNPPTSPDRSQDTAEIASKDEPTTFKVNVKLVVVRAVVRDSQGHAVGNLRKEDFQVFDKGKPQVITQFEVEQPGALATKANQTSVEETGIARTAPPNIALPERFFAFMFDDIHIEFGDLARVQAAAERYLATLRPTDRAAIFTTSGLITLDYTDDRAKLRDTLLSITPHPVTGDRGDCPDIGYYQADRILNKNDLTALQLAVQEAAGCLQTDLSGAPLGDPAPLATAAARAALSAGDYESRMALADLDRAVRSVSQKPGQRSVVLVSPGFITPTLEYEFYELVDRAVRERVVINTLDARGLYGFIPYGDASHQPSSRLGAGHGPPPGKTLIQSAAAAAQDDLLMSLANITGGFFFHNNNDFDEGFRRAAQPPEYTYVLAFTPQNLKADGHFHPLKVQLVKPNKLSVQARQGYFAPKKFTSPDEQAQEEIREAMYSQEEIHNLPVSLKTQFFKSADSDAKIFVLAHVDVQHLHFRKADGRNVDVLTCVSALFNRNGNFIEGTEKTVTMHLKDETLRNKLANGITLKSSFDVKPGNYIVRLVVRDSEGQLLTAENGTIEIR